MVEAGDGGDGGPRPGPVGRLAGSVRGMLATLLAIGQTRLELLTVEVQLEMRRITTIGLLLAVVVACAGAGLLMTGMAVVLAFWDSHRLLAAVLVAIAYLALAAAALMVISRRLHARPRFLEGTLAEFARDAAQLRGRD